MKSKQINAKGIANIKKKKINEFCPVRKMIYLLF